MNIKRSHICVVIVVNPLPSVFYMKNIMLSRCTWSTSPTLITWDIANLIHIG